MTEFADALLKSWWFWPMLAALVLISIHTYLGLHVISRKVLFVDLALAQIAALGTTVAFLFGFEQRDDVTYYVSLLFGVVGAWVFAVTRVKGDRVPQEAVIGLSFAIASAGSILLSAENPHGAEHLRDILAGSILVVRPKDVGNAAIVYALIALLHGFFRRPFLLISTDPEEARRRGMQVRLWDFFFYATFALVITLSVHIAGVLLVFCLLIAPAVCGALFATGFRARLFIGWGTSVLAAVGGLILCAYTDWPPAPCIICVYAAVLILTGLIGHVRHSEDRMRAVLNVCGGTALLAIAAFGLIAFLRSDFAHSLREKEDDHAAHVHGDGDGEPDRRSGSSLDDLLAALKDPSMAVKEKAAEALGRIGDPRAAEALAAALDVKDEDEWVMLREAEALVRCGGAAGMTALIRIARDAEAKVARTEAFKKALIFSGQPEGKTTLQALSAWWERVKATARWDPAAGRFIVPE